MSQIKYQGAAPYFPPEDRQAMTRDFDEILATGQLTQGKWLTEFEESCAAMAGTRHAIAVNSGGTALELTLEAIDIDGTQVIVPADTFVATPNSVVRAGGTPIFADISPENLSLSLAGIDAVCTGETIGVILVHMFGLMGSHIDAIRDFCDSRAMFLIEDAAHAHGAAWQGKPAGSLGLAGCFSYFGTKVVTSGEGGVVTTDDDELAAAVRSLRDHGRAASGGVFDRAGNNFRLAEIPAMIGTYQNCRLPEILAHRRKLAEIYRNALQGSDLLTLVDPAPHDGHSYWRYPILLDARVDRKKLQSIMADKYATRITWMYEPLCHQQPYYAATHDVSISYPLAEDAIRRLVNLPTHMGVDLGGAEYIAAGLLVAAKEAIA